MGRFPPAVGSLRSAGSCHLGGHHPRRPRRNGFFASRLLGFILVHACLVHPLPASIFTAIATLIDSFLPLPLPIPPVPRDRVNDQHCPSFFRYETVAFFRCPASPWKWKGETPRTKLFMALMLTEREKGRGVKGRAWPINQWPTSSSHVL